MLGVTLKSSSFDNKVSHVFQKKCNLSWSDTITPKMGLFLSVSELCSWAGEQFSWVSEPCSWAGEPCSWVSEPCSFLND